MSNTKWLRFGGKLISVEDLDAEARVFGFIRDYLFLTYCTGSTTIAEFGCGSCQNLLRLAQLFPDSKIRGYDWVEPSVAIANHLGSDLRQDITGALFDIKAPDFTVEFDRPTTALTIHALEQVGDEFKRFVEFLIQQKVSRVVNLEPINELYDESQFLDFLALSYHRSRGYLWGYLSHLQQLESNGQVVIDNVTRIRFGSRFHEAYSVIVWHPVL